jgi:tRNA (guanine37-N1)-methyltransferase
LENYMHTPQKIAPSSWAARVITLFPAMFPGPLGHSLAGKALECGIWSLETVDIRTFSRHKHRAVDDTPYGGGNGMVLMAPPLAAAIEASVKTDRAPLLYLTPRGKPLTQDKVEALAKAQGAVILCGRYEGVDQRVIEHFGFEEVSIGDYVLSGGELAALVLLDSVVRILPGVLGNQAQTLREESFSDGLLEYPHYTRPANWRGYEVPEVLLSGDHQAIKAWRHLQAAAVTCVQRPDLWHQYLTAGGKVPVGFDDKVAAMRAGGSLGLKAFA